MASRSKATGSRWLQTLPKPLATSALGRLGKTVQAAVSAGASIATGSGQGLAALSPQAAEQLVRSFGQLKGIAMKMGQILSYVDESLPEESQVVLSELQRFSQPTAWHLVEKTLTEDLGARANELLGEMPREPMASASIGQVYRAKLSAQGEVAIKVRHAGIVEAMRSDFRAALPAVAMAQLLVPGVDARHFVAEAKHGFLGECDYEAEAAHQRSFGQAFADHPLLHVPRVYGEYCGPRVLVTEFCEGQTLEQYLAGSPSLAERNAIAEALYEFYLGSLYSQGLFNADPHPGNLVFQEGGRVAVLDYGCVREFDAGTVQALKSLSKAVMADERRGIEEALGQLGAVKPSGEAAYSVTRGLLRSFYEPLLYSEPQRIEARAQGSFQSTAALKMKIMKLHLPGRLLFLFRIRFGLYAVLRRLGAELRWSELEERVRDGSPGCTVPLPRSEADVQPGSGD